MKKKIPVWGDVPEYEDWILALGLDDTDESYGAYLDAFGDEIEEEQKGSSTQFEIMKNNFDTALRNGDVD